LISWNRMCHCRHFSLREMILIPMPVWPATVDPRRPRGRIVLCRNDGRRSFHLRGLDVVFWAILRSASFYDDVYYQCQQQEEDQEATNCDDKPSRSWYPSRTFSTTRFIGSADVPTHSGKGSGEGRCSPETQNTNPRKLIEQHFRIITFQKGSFKCIPVRKVRSTLELFSDIRWPADGWKT